MARERIIDKKWDSGSNTITFTAKKAGRTTKEGHSVVFDITKLSSEGSPEMTAEEYKHDLALHGASQKIGDSYASTAGDVDLAFDNLNETIQQMYEGKWAERGEGEGMRIGELAEAVAFIKGLEVDAVRTMLRGPEAPANGASQEEKDAYAADKEQRTKKINELRKHPQVKLVIAQQRMQKLEAAMREGGEVPELSM